MTENIFKIILIGAVALTCIGTYAFFNASGWLLVIAAISVAYIGEMKIAPKEKKEKSNKDKVATEIYKTKD